MINNFQSCQPINTAQNQNTFYFINTIPWREYYYLVWYCPDIYFKYWEVLIKVRKNISKKSFLLTENTFLFDMSVKKHSLLCGIWMRFKNQQYTLLSVWISCIFLNYHSWVQLIIIGYPETASIQREKFQQNWNNKKITGFYFCIYQ